jgi:thymidylate synthase
MQNAKMVDGPAPSEIFYKWRLRGKLPQLRMKVDVAKGESDRQKRREAYLKTGPKSVLKEVFDISNAVWMQDEKTKLWDTEATIEKVCSKRRSYYVTNDQGQYLRNRKFLKRRYVDTRGCSILDKESAEAAEAADSGDIPVGPHQSARQEAKAHKEVRFTE